jgi:hypothetical protein
MRVFQPDPRNCHHLDTNSHGPGENQDIDAFGAGPQKRARRGLDDCPRGHDILDKDNRAPFDLSVRIGATNFVRSIRIPQSATLLLLPTDIAEHVRMDVQADIGEVVEMFAGHEPDDLADFTLGIEAGHGGETIRIDLLVPG